MVPFSPTVMNVLFPYATPERLIVVTEVLEVQEVPFKEVRIVPLSPTVTKIPFACVIPTRLYFVPEFLLSQVAPFEEVSMIPLSPTVTNNPLLENVTLSSLPPHEIMLRLKRNTEKIMEIYFTWFSIDGFYNN